MYRGAHDVSAASNDGALTDTTADGRHRLSIVWAEFVARHYVLLIGVASFLLYVVTWPANRTESIDGYTYAATVEDGVELVNPRHLIYRPLMRVAYLTIRTVYAPIRAHTILTTVSLVAAVVTVCLVAWILRELLRRPLPVAVAGAAVLATSYGFWRYATEAEMYAPASMLATATVALAFRRNGYLRLPTVAVGTLAVLVHTANVVPVLVAVAIGVMRQHGRPAAVAYMVRMCGSIIVSASVILLVSRGTGLATVADRPIYDGLLTYPKSVVGLAQAVVSGNFLFANETFAELLRSLFPSKSFVDETFMGQHASDVTRYVGPLSAALVVGVLAWAAVLVWRNRQRPVVCGEQTRGLRATIVIWLAGMGAVGIVMSGGEPEGWLLVLPPLVMALATWAFSRLYEVSPVTLMLVPIAMLVHNLVGGILMVQSPDGDYNRATVAWILDEAGPADVVISSGNQNVTGLLRLETPAQVTMAYLHTAEELESVALGEGRGRVFVTADVLDPPPWVGLLHPQGAAEMSAFVTSLGDRIETVHAGELDTVYIVD